MKVRRVVTGLDSAGRSCIALDGPVEAVSEKGVKALWVSEGFPTRNDGDFAADGFAFDFDTTKRGGVAFLVVEFPPGEALTLPGMHTTDTLDYTTILRGQLEYVTETGKVILGPGDVLVGRGVFHGSRAVGTENVLLSVVMVPAKPVGKGATI